MTALSRVTLASAGLSCFTLLSHSVSLCGAIETSVLVMCHVLYTLSLLLEVKILVKTANF